MMAFKIPRIGQKRKRTQHLFGRFDWKEVEKLNYIANGSFGTVFSGIYKQENVVVKRLDQLNMDSEEEKSFQKEAAILNALKHENIVSFKAFCDNPFAIMLEYVYFSFEIFGEDKIVSSLSEFLTHTDKETDFVGFEIFASHITLDIAKGLQYLHEKDVVHRDLKPGNVLVSNKHYNGIRDEEEKQRIFIMKPIVCKVTDFGESRSNLIQTQTMVRTTTTRLIRGTPIYMAPETRLGGKKEMTNKELMKADMWSLGMTIFSILSPDMKVPFSKELRNFGRDWTTALDDMLRNKQKPEMSVKYENLRLNDWKHVYNIYNKCTSFDVSVRPFPADIVKELTEAKCNDMQVSQESNASCNPSNEKNVKVQLSVSQSTAISEYDEKICQHLTPSWPRNDGTNACSFLCVCIAVKLMNSNIFQAEWTLQSLTKLVEKTILEAPYIFNIERDVERMYDIAEAFAILDKCKILTSSLYDISEEMVSQYAFGSAAGKQQLEECVQKLQQADTISTACYTCGEYILSLVCIHGKLLLTDTHPVPSAKGGNGNGLINVIPCSATSAKMVSQCIWERLESSGVPSTSIQSFVVITKRTCQEDPVNNVAQASMFGTADQNVKGESVQYTVHVEDDQYTVQGQNDRYRLTVQRENDQCTVQRENDKDNRVQGENDQYPVQGENDSMNDIHRESLTNSGPVFEYRNVSYSAFDLLNILVFDKRSELLCTKVPKPPVKNGCPESCCFKVTREILKDTVDASNCGAWVVQGSACKPYFAVKDSSSEMLIKVLGVKVDETNTAVYNTRVGREYIEKVAKADDVFILKRYYAYNKSNENYRRIVSEVRKLNSDEWLNYALIQYFWEGEPRPLQIKPHGNAKNITRPYIRTQESVLRDMGSALKGTSSYNDVYRSTFELAGGINARDASKEPRDRQQLYNVNRGMSQQDKRMCSNDWLGEVILQQQNPTDYKSKFVRNIKLGEKGPMGVNFIDQQVEDVARFCTVPGFCSVLSVDTTYNLGEFYVTNTAFKNLSLINEKTGKNPFFMGPCVVHFSRNEEPFSFLGSEMKLVNSNVEHIQFIGTDEEKNIFEGLRKGIGGNPTNILCTNHFKDNVRRKLRDLSFPTGSENEIIKDIFGEQQGEILFKGLIDSDSEHDFTSKLNILVEKWNAIESRNTRNSPPKFADYFVRYKATAMVEKMIMPIREKAGFGSPPAYYNQNGIECMNFLSKHSVTWKKNKWVVFNDKQAELVHRQYREAEKAVFGAGEYCLSEHFKNFYIPPNTWRCMSTEQRLKHLKNFFSHKPEPLSVSRRGSIRVISKPDEEKIKSSCDVKLSVPSAAVTGVSVSIETLNKIWRKAEQLLCSKHDITQAPGNLPNGRMVSRYGSSVKDNFNRKKGATSPVVLVIYEDDKMHCECPFFSSMKLCSHAVAVAEVLGKLSEYVQWLNKKKKPTNLAAFYQDKIPKNAGKKPKQLKRKKGTPKIKGVEERVQLPQAQFTEIYHNENPFRIQFLKGKKKVVCASCKVDFPCKFMISPFDICLVHEERYFYPNTDGKWVPTVCKTRDTYYHLDLKKCILPRHPYFNIHMLKIEDSDKSHLKQGHIALLEHEFGYKL